MFSSGSSPLDVREVHAHALGALRSHRAKLQNTQVQCMLAQPICVRIHTMKNPGREEGTSLRPGGILPFEARIRSGQTPEVLDSEAGMIRLEPLIELKFIDSSFSSSTCSTRVFRAYPLIEIRQALPCRGVRGRSISVGSTLPPPLVDSLRTGLGSQVFRDFKDKVYPLFESDTWVLECFFCAV